jgi:hypothetical protein
VGPPPGRLFKTLKRLENMMSEFMDELIGKEVYVYEYTVKNHGVNKKEVVGTAKFCGFGVDYEEFDSGPGPYTTAILLFNDGHVELKPVSLIKFCKEAL